MISIVKTKHVVDRQQQRGLRNDILEFILDFGHVEHGARAVWYRIRQGELPSYLREGQLAERARNWAVMIDPTDQCVITVYARHDVSRHVRQKCHKRRQWMKNLQPQSRT